MSAFQRERPQPLMAGTKPSLQNGQLRASTGNASVDAILSTCDGAAEAGAAQPLTHYIPPAHLRAGGGLPVGALWLLEEDRYATYSRALQRYFLGEGAVHGHRLFVATLDEDAREFVRNRRARANENHRRFIVVFASAQITKIPQPCDEQTPSSVAGKQRPQPTDTPPVIGAAAAAVADDLRIAWRYNGLPQVDAEQRSAVGATHSFDLTANIDAAELAALTVRTFSQTEADSDDGDAAGRTDGFRNPVYGRLLRAIGDELAAQQRQQQLDGVGRLLRICIAGLGGPLWYGAEMSADVCRFLVVLRALLRRSPAVCCLSMPAHLFAYHVSD